MLAEEGAKSVVLLSRRGVISGLGALVGDGLGFGSGLGLGWFGMGFGVVFGVCVRLCWVGFLCFGLLRRGGAAQVMISRVCGRSCRTLTWNSK